MRRALNGRLFGLPDLLQVGKFALHFGDLFLDFLERNAGRKLRDPEALRGYIDHRKIGVAALVRLDEPEAGIIDTVHGLIAKARDVQGRSFPIPE